jgi:hypothetical protein
MLWSPAYLESPLPRPLPTKDGGILSAVKDIRVYVLGLPDSRSEHHLYWQRAHQLLLDQADVVTLRRQVELAWFVCPHFNRRVRKLYLPLGGRHLWSRRAYRLAYASQRETVYDRALASCASGSVAIRPMGRFVNRPAGSIKENPAG